MEEIKHLNILKINEGQENNGKRKEYGGTGIIIS
jgi:hypothetical protein